MLLLVLSVKGFEVMLLLLGYISFGEVKKNFRILNIDELRCLYIL